MTFDPYRKWLGIPTNKRPPNFYDLLGITEGENDTEVIRNAIEQRRVFVQSKRGEGLDEHVRIILGLIEEATSTLLVPEFKNGYDRQLGLHLKGKRKFTRRSYILPSWMESRVVRVYGEGSGIVGDLFGIVAIIFSAFALMACLSFWLQAKTTKNGTSSEPTWIENLVYSFSGTNGTTDSPESTPSVANPIQAQVAELRSKLTKWQESQEKLKRLVNTLEKDRKSILGKLDDLAKNKTGGENSPEGKVLAAELNDIMRQTEACKTKQSAYDLAILKSESKLRSIERQLAASEAGVSEAELTELAATVMALDESLSDQDTVNSIADALDGSTSKMLNEFRDNRKQTEQSGWFERVASMPASRQADEVGKKLVELNPGFDGKLETKIVGSAIVELSMVTDRVSDISPLAVLKDLTSVSLRGSTVDWNTRSGTGKVSEIRPLKGMRLTNLDLVFNPIENISVIEGMPLAVLDIAFSPNISDISVVRGMPLVRFQCQDTNVTDLSPLAGMKLQHININHTPISNLEPLRGMPLQFLNCGETSITSIEPIRGAPVNSLIMYSTKVSDLSPVEGMPLKSLSIYKTDVSDLTPLSKKALEELIFSPESSRTGIELIRKMKSITRISDVTWKTESPDVFWRRIDGGNNISAQSEAGPIPIASNQSAESSNAKVNAKSIKSKNEAIFDGQSLNGWHTDGNQWQVRNGVLIGEKLEPNEAGSFLISDKSYKNFELYAEFRLLEGNSGIQIRSQAKPTGMVVGPQADITFQEEYRWLGCLTGERIQPAVIAQTSQGIKDRLLQVVDPKGWNSMKISVKGQQTTIFINDVKTVQSSLPTGFESGVIALQLHGGGRTRIEFRKMEIEEVKNEQTFDPFKQNTVWSNSGLTLTVIERRGGTFRARLECNEWARNIRGTIKDGQVTWLAKDVQPIKGGIGGDNFGTISKDKEGYRMDVEWKQSNGVSGTETYRLND